VTFGFASSEPARTDKGGKPEGQPPARRRGPPEPSRAGQRSDYWARAAGSCPR
jgi:hypothetical protein